MILRFRIPSWSVSTRCIIMIIASCFLQKNTATDGSSSVNDINGSPSSVSGIATSTILQPHPTQLPTAPPTDLPTAPGNRPCNPTLAPISCNSVLGRGTTYSYPRITQEIPQVTEQILEGTILFAQNLSPPPNPICVDFLMHILCILGAPPCNPDTSLPILICDRSCRAYQKVERDGSCTVIGDRLVALGMISHISALMVFVDAYFNFDCRDTSSYFFLNITDPDPTKCTTLFNPEVETAILEACDEDEVNSNCTETKINRILPLVILLPLSFCVSIFTFVIICWSCCYLYRKRKQRKESLILRDDGVVMSDLFHPYTGGPDTREISYKVSSNSTSTYKTIFMSITIPYEAITVGDVIGQGAFGKVYLGDYKSENGPQEVAIKTLKDLRSDDELEEFFSETMIMKDFRHPNVLSLVGVVFDTPDEVPYLILPFMELGNLKSFLKSKRVKVSNIHTLPKEMKISTIIRMCMDVTMGMEYLSEKLFVHRDLAARNCMVNQDLLVKVGDFGLARDVYSTDYYRSNKKFAKLPVKWMPPETFNDKISNEKTDVWSYGVTCWEIFSLGRTPYPTVENSDIFSYISEGRRLEKPTLCPDKIFELIVKCWGHKPEDRPTFQDLAKTLTEYWDETHGYI